MDISIIIPAYNEAPKIGRDVEAAVSFILRNSFEGEVIVVDDGSSDETAKAARVGSAKETANLQILRFEKNSGKGAAVRAGILRSRGEVAMYSDSGLCIPFTDALPVIERIRAGELDMGLASRRLRESVICRDRPLSRKILSRVFHWLAARIAGLPSWITDSQCGFKVYRGEFARTLFAGLETTGFLFELEIILKSIRHGWRIEEFPVEWTCDLDTRLRPAAHAGGVIKEMFRLRRMARKQTLQSR